MSKIHITADEVQEYIEERDYPKNALESLFAAIETKTQLAKENGE